MVDAASSLDPTNWFPLQRVIRAIGVSCPPPEGLLTPKEAALIVEQYFDILESGLGQSGILETKARLSELERFATKRMMDRVKDAI
jgi:hypothetical protein